MKADHVVVGSCIHARVGDPRPGFVAIADGRVVALDSEGGDPGELVGAHTIVTDAGDGAVLPGFHDHHTFFTSQLLETSEWDAAVCSDDELATVVRKARGTPVFVHGAEHARAVALAARFTQEDSRADVVLLTRNRESIELTAAARTRVGEIDPASNESLHPVYAQLAADGQAVERAFTAAARRMHRGGVVSVKDIAFDTHLGMLPRIDALIRDDVLGLRYAFASQPVASVADLDAAHAWLHHPFGASRFFGFKLMTDGSFDEKTADLLSPAEPARMPEQLSFDADRVRSEAERILDAGFRLALNADGDASARACIDVFASYEGRLPKGCSLSDASLLQDVDAVGLSNLGVAVELYTQLLRLPGYSVNFLERYLIGSQRRRLGQLATLLNAGVVVASGSDFPLFSPSLPEAMLSASELALGEGAVNERWPHGVAASRTAVARVWTEGGALVMDDPDAGSLRRGAHGDVVVFDRDLFSVPAEELVGLTPSLVLAAGDVVHAR